MSYVLHIWGHPEHLSLPASVEEADGFLSVAMKINVGQNSKFLTLAGQLTAKYPCLCSAEAEVLPQDELAWSDGPLNGRTESAVYSIGLNVSMLDEVLPFVVETAKALGLSVMDEQAGQVFLANGRVLSVPRPVPANPAPLKNYDDCPKPQQVRQIVFERLAPFLEKHGYKARKSDTSFICRFPNGWHTLEIDTLDYWPSSAVFRVGGFFRFNPVTDLICSINGTPSEEIKHHYTRVLGQKMWMDEEREFIRKPNKEYQIKSFSELDMVMQHLIGKLESVVLPLVEKCKTIEGLDEVMNPVPVSDSIFFSSYERGAEHIIAAYIAHNPRLEDLCEECLTITEKRNGYPHLKELLRKCVDYVHTHPLR